MPNPFFEDEEEDMHLPLPTETITVNGTRPNSQVIYMSPSSEKGPVRDAIMLESFLSTTLPHQTLIILIKLLNERLSQNEAIMEQMLSAAKKKAKEEKEVDELGFSPPLTEEEKEDMKRIERDLFGLDVENPKPKRGRPKKKKPEGE